jgi:hypothetical protein
MSDNEREADRNRDENENEKRGPPRQWPPEGQRSVTGDAQYTTVCRETTRSAVLKN